MAACRMPSLNATIVQNIEDLTLCLLTKQMCHHAFALIAEVGSNHDFNVLHASSTPYQEIRPSSTLGATFES